MLYKAIDQNFDCGCDRCAISLIAFGLATQGSHREECHSKGEPAKSKSARKRAGTGGRAKYVQAARQSDSADDALEDSMMYKIKDSQVKLVLLDHL